MYLTPFRFALEECKKLNPSTKGVEITSTAKSVVKSLCEHLLDNGIFLETYAGKSGEQPEEQSADSKSSWNMRDKCFDYLYSSENLIQISGKKLNKLNDGRYPWSQDFRCWQRKAI